MARTDAGTEYGLWLNELEVEQRRSAAVARGVAAAMSKRPLQKDWFEATSLTPEEATRDMHAENEARSILRAKEKLGWRE